MRLLLWVGVAGAVGAVLRFLVGSWFIEADADGFPLGTLFCNMLGSFALAWLYRASARRFERLASEEIVTIVGTGLLGSFTTFSALSAETIAMLHDERMLAAAAYCLITTIGGIALSWAGWILGSGVTAKR